MNTGLKCPASIYPVECNDRFMLVVSLQPHYRSSARFDGSSRGVCSTHVAAAGVECWWVPILLIVVQGEVGLVGFVGRM